jgi:hypothetical protein
VADQCKLKAYAKDVGPPSTSVMNDSSGMKPLLPDWKSKMITSKKWLSNQGLKFEPMATGTDWYLQPQHM